MSPDRPHIGAVAADATHRFSKPTCAWIRLVAALGVEGDAHAGVTVRHRSRVAIDPTQPNLRQVHLIQGELLDDLARRGFAIAPGELGENVTTRGIDLLALPRGARLRLGDAALVEVTGLRNPCAQIDAFHPGLLSQVVGRDIEGAIVRRAGLMGVVLESGTVRPGDPVAATLPPPPHLPLERV